MVCINSHTSNSETDENRYACGNASKFVGCCEADPCASAAGCSAGNLRPASFDTSFYGTEAMPDQQCAASGSQWYTCTGTKPAFLGCCSSNACATTTGCPADNLIQGVLSQVEVCQLERGWFNCWLEQASAHKMDPQPPVSGSSDAENAGGSGTSTGIIAGSVVGGVAVLAIIVAVVWWMLRRRTQKNNHNQKENLLNIKSQEKNTYQGKD